MRFPRSVITTSAVIFLLCAAGASAQIKAVPQRELPPAPAVPPMQRFDVNLLDRNADPCTDLYQYACAKWMAANPIPPDEPIWGRFHVLAERNRAVLRDILEKAAAPDPRRTPVMQKIGDYYASCMDEKAIEQQGLAPLKPELDRIGSLTDKKQLALIVAGLQRFGAGAPFRFTSAQDFKDATQVIAMADQGGLGLPDRDYYFRQDAKSVALRKQYVQHVQNMFQLLGEPAAQAAAGASTVLEMETALAKASLDRVRRREPANVYHKMTREQLRALAPSFNWDEYIQAVGAPSVAALNVAVPEFFRGLQALIQSASLDDWKTYLRWHALNRAAPLLPERFVEEDFAFNGKALMGAQQLRPRWNRCVRFTDRDLGEALGQPYVDETFGVEGKQRMLNMVQRLENALRQDIRQLPWMTEATKKQALLKLDKIANKIGYPDKWRDYSKLEIVRGDALGNATRAAAFELQRRLNKIGKPVDRQDWEMSPPTVNAYYDAHLNDINFPAGILQPPFFDNQLDDAPNFGGIGAVIGHELTHGFDDAGRKFDGDGNLRDWWTPADATAFNKRAACFVDEYQGFVAVDDVHLDGRLTLGENTADNGGLRIALMALLDDLKQRPAPPVDGFSPEQRFFLGWAQIWCQNQTPEIARMLAQTDPHSPGRYRVNGTVSNMPEFQRAFNCKAGAPMVRENKCRVW